MCGSGLPPEELGEAAMIRIAVVGLRGMHRVIGGIETHCRSLYPALASRRGDFDITVFERSRYHHMSPSYPANLKVRALWAPNLSALEAFLHTLFAILVAAVRVRPDVIHIHAIGPGIWTPLARMLGMRVIVTIHARDFERPKWNRLVSKSLRFGEYLSCRFAHAIVCVSNAGLEDLGTRYSRYVSRFHVIPHGTSRLPELPVGTVEAKDAAGVFEELGIQPGNYMLAVGRFDRVKRFQDLVKARAALRESEKPLVIVGSAVGDSAQSGGLDELTGRGVVLAGPRFAGQLDQLYHHAALFIHPSQMEGFALVVLEALNSGIPMALSDLPEHREFGLPTQCYFPVGDVAAITRIMAMPDHAPLKPKITQEGFARFTHTGMIDQYEALFETVYHEP